MTDDQFNKTFSDAFGIDLSSTAPRRSLVKADVDAIVDAIIDVELDRERNPVREVSKEQYDLYQRMLRDFEPPGAIERMLGIEGVR